MDDWIKHAACRGLDVAIFYPEHGGTARPAIAVCRSCPVARHCLDDAMRRDEEWGVWGGKSPRERRAMRRAR